MKQLKFIVFALALIVATSVSAQVNQALVRLPEAEMREPSQIDVLGENLQTVDVTNVRVLVEEEQKAKRGRMVGRGDNIGDPGAIQPEPIGDAVWPLLLLAVGYLCVCFKKSKAA